MSTNTSPSGKVTIATVAKACGVAPSTVSRVLNQDKSFSLRSEIREKVLRKAQELNYRPQLAARSLRADKTRLIGLLGSSSVHANSGLTIEANRALVNNLHQKGYDAFISYPNRNRPQSALPPWSFDAAVVTSGDDEGAQKLLRQSGTPFVCMNAADPGENWAVVVDEGMGMSQAVDKLVQLGHRRIAYLTSQSKKSHCSEDLREQAYETEMKRRELPLLTGSTDRKVVLADTLQHWVQNKEATAVIVYDHLHAVRLLREASKLDISIPNDLSVICFNNEFPVAELRPSLTCIAIPPCKLAQATTELLMAHIETGPQAPAQRITIPVELVERESTAPPPPGH
ncbi:LacI family DNA-binding transcriptional regulator [Kiritimatiellaeota bacterium B1221]|nr:LacI family DNA-binding transcriptional regulator [Kiritimatiellaeota bacterium B1221]